MLALNRSHPGIDTLRKEVLKVAARIDIAQMRKGPRSLIKTIKVKQEKALQRLPATRYVDGLHTSLSSEKYTREMTPDKYDYWLERVCSDLAAKSQNRAQRIRVLSLARD